VSAVGHEVDVTIADLVADARAPTPTAAAELVVPRKLDLVAVVERHRGGLGVRLRRHLEARRREVESLRARLRDPHRAVRSARARACEIELRIVRALERRVEGSRATVLALEERMLFSSPLRRTAAVRAEIGDAIPRLTASLRHRIEIARERVARLAGSLSSLSPLAVLDRGYAVVWRSGEERPLRSSTDVVRGDPLRIRLARGGLRARVETRDDGDE
jgi:exodeoxyribonuclease VII large subunit